MYKKQSWVQYSGLLTGKCFILIICVLIFYLSKEEWVLRPSMAVKSLWIAISVCSVLLSLYRIEKGPSILLEIKRMVCLLGLTYLFTFLIDRTDLMKSTGAIFAIVIYWIPCYLLHLWVWASYSPDRSIVIVTTDSRKNHMKRILEIAGYKVSGIVVIDGDTDISGKVPLFSCKDADAICRMWADEVYIDKEGCTVDYDRLIESFVAMGLVIHIRVPSRNMGAYKKQFVETIGGEASVTMSLNCMEPQEIFIKRLFDIFGGLVGCIITVLLTILFGPFIILKSPGPVFYSQIRIGQGGKKFKIYKFRTMTNNADSEKEKLRKEFGIEKMMFKMEFDPRVIGNRIVNGKQKTGIGQFMRKFSIDEFPQFFNVLKGDMSIVGTRPPTIDEWEKYEYHHRARMAVKPGITGFWQINGRNNIEDFEEVVKLDVQYITEWSLWLDVKIIFNTVLMVLKREGAV